MHTQRRERDHYSQFVTEDFGAYLQRKRCGPPLWPWQLCRADAGPFFLTTAADSQAKTFGNNIEVQALSEVYGRVVEVFRYHIGAARYRRLEEERAGRPRLTLFAALLLHRAGTCLHTAA